MMILQLVSEDNALLHSIADYLLKEELITNVMISDEISFKYKADDGTIQTIKKFTLKGISKSLLFNTINKQLKNRYKERLPLLYSEPIILIDPDYRDDIMESLSKV